MRHADELVSREMTGQRVACKKGCSWCCHQLVVVTHWADGEAVLQAARQRLTRGEFSALERRIREQAAQINGMSHEEAETRRWTCPLLRNGECLVYDVRPVACRTVFSSDSECCRAMMEAGDFAELSEPHQRLATEISERAFRLDSWRRARTQSTFHLVSRPMIGGVFSRSSSKPTTSTRSQSAYVVTCTKR